MQPPRFPPPPPHKNTRKHERFELYASVELHGHGETLILPARNISLGGVQLATDGHDLSGFAVGAELDLLVFDALNEKKKPARLRAQVVRHDEAGMALMWSSTDSDAATKLAALLDTMQPKPAGGPKAP